MGLDDVPPAPVASPELQRGRTVRVIAQHPLPVFCSLSQSVCPCLSLSLYLFLSLSLCFFLSLSLSLSLTHTYKHTHAQSFPLSLCLSFRYLPLSLSLSLTQRARRHFPLQQLLPTPTPERHVLNPQPSTIREGQHITSLGPRFPFPPLETSLRTLPRDKPAEETPARLHPNPYKTQVAVIAGVCGGCIALMLVLGAVTYKVRAIRRLKVTPLLLGGASRKIRPGSWPPSTAPSTLHPIHNLTYFTSA